MELVNDGMKINIGNNQIRNVKSYEDIIKMKLSHQYKVISPQEYLSLLFYNLGYTHRANNFMELNNLYPLENIYLNQEFTFPTGDYWNLLINQNSDTLYHTLYVIQNWIINKDIERGHILDVNKSFIRPSDEELKFNLKNNISTSRTGDVKTETDYWNRNNFFIRRLYNISPKIDKEYFSKCIINFTKISKTIKIWCPWIVFVSCLVDQDLFFNAIRTAEKEAYDYVYKMQEEKNCITPILITDKQLAKPFELFLNKQIAHLVNIYEKHEYQGFIINKPQVEQDIVKTQLPVDTSNYTTIGNNIILDQNTINNINNQIFGTTLDGDHKSYILQYVDSNSLNVLNELGEDSIVRKNTYKKLYYTIMQIKESVPELLNRKNKFLFSSPFYINQEIFALYHKTRNTFFVTFPDLILREMSPKKAIEFYKTYLNIDVKLDSKEMMDSYDSPSVPYIDLKVLDEQGYIVEQKQVHKNIQIEEVKEEEQPIKQVPTENNNEYIGYDINEVVAS